MPQALRISSAICTTPALGDLESDGIGAAGLYSLACRGAAGGGWLLLQATRSVRTGRAISDDFMRSLLRGAGVFRWQQRSPRFDARRLAPSTLIDRSFAFTAQYQRHNTACRLETICTRGASFWHTAAVLRRFRIGRQKLTQGQL